MQGAGCRVQVQCRHRNNQKPETRNQKPEEPAKATKSQRKQSITKRHMSSQVRNIKNQEFRNGFENDLMITREDSELFETIGDYMKGRSDLEDVQNDPSLSDTMESVTAMMSDYNINRKSEINKNEKFIREIFSGEAKDDKLKNEINIIKQDIEENKLNEITADWVREWHERKQKMGVINARTEEITDFVVTAINSSGEDTAESASEVIKKSSRRTTFVRYSSFAAAALIGAFILIRTLLPSADPGKIFNSYYKPFEAISPVTRGVNTNNPDSYSSAIRSYKTGNYTEAAILFAGVSAEDPSYSSSHFFMGLSHLALNNYNQAIALLSERSVISGEYGKEARWYLGLAYLKTSDKKKASECFEYLSASDGFYRERSEKILRLLK